ncbi:MAG: nitroreductase family protein [Sandaracinaceae bacterium]
MDQDPASAYRPVPYRPPRVEPDETVARLQRDYEVMSQRRSVRRFSTDPVPAEAIEHAIRIAGTAPSGAHRQPWYFVAISDPVAKRQMREAAEREERAFYETRVTPDWREALAPLGTDFVKTHITDAPWVIVVFRRDFEELEDGRRLKGYYLNESVGIAVGMLIGALHRAGLASLTHTPAPMTFLRELCGRPANEKPFVILPVGYPHPDCEVPDLARKSLAEIAELR